MSSRYWEFPSLDDNDTVVINVETQCEVFLVDDSNFSSLKRGGRFTGFGGAQKFKNVRLSPPRSGRWHLVLIPYPGTTVYHSEPVVI